MNSDKIITGERIQEIADIYLGEVSNFQYNPRIIHQIHKQKNINEIQNEYNNPRIIYFYTHDILKIVRIIAYFQNPFILISHNSDENIIETQETHTILNSPLLINWYSQNVCFYHPKLHMIPIGIANSMWPHGNLSPFNNNELKININNKKNRIFFNFNIHTNPRIRQPCYNILSNYYPSLPNISPEENIKRLSTYEFCISPEGNGVDCHRLWEALYLKVVPIVLRTPFTETLLINQIPLVVLNSWEDLPIIEKQLKYNNYDFSIIENKFTMDRIREIIISV
jgi:hypothetical protein